VCVCVCVCCRAKSVCMCACMHALTGVLCFSFVYTGPALCTPPEDGDVQPCPVASVQCVCVGRPRPPCLGVC